MYQSKYARGNKTGTQLRGLFENGQWKCDCTPRYPAISFEVKKPGPNQGKLFYTCAHEKRCGFFLWRHDAVVRESRAVLANSRTEPQSALEPAGRAGAHDAGAQTATSIVAAGVGGASKTAVTPTHKRAARSKTPESRPSLPPIPPAPEHAGRSHLPEDTPSRSSHSFLTTSRGGDTTSFELTSDDEKALAQAEEQAGRQAVQQQQTTRAVEKDHGAAVAAAIAPPISRSVQFTTPLKRKFADMAHNDSDSLPTPETHESKKRQITPATRATHAPYLRTTAGETLDELLNLVSPQTTPTPARFKNVGPAAGPAAGLGGNEAAHAAEEPDLWSVVEGILQEERAVLDVRGRQRLREACTVHARRHKGILQGRNILRKALNVRDHKIALLEAELDVEREVIKCLRDDA